MKEILTLLSQDQDNSHVCYEEIVKSLEVKVRNIREKVAVLTENKELLMKER